jgi:hypothetical protein
VTYFTHRRFIGWRCCGCGKYLWELQWAKRIPVCADADLAFIEARE